MRAVDYDRYLRPSHIPHIWCPGCGHGVALKTIVRAFDKLDWDPEKIVAVSGIGCSGRATGYLNCNSLHTTHGRALAFATGVKLVNPELNVVVITGDGDGISIGGNHLIHAARRNLDINVVLFNNNIYGMTGGQVSPTTPLGCKSTTTPYGSYEHSFDIAGLVAAAGGNFVARSTVYHAVQLEKLMCTAFERKGFSFIEVMSGCPTAFGRKNRLRSAVSMFQDMKDRAVPIVKARQTPLEELEGKIVTGILLDRNKVEYGDLYRSFVERIRGM
jgi:2-oxoglutarate/2-oxoacid ferredoxin oxidoreductase subunit beta